MKSEGVYPVEDATTSSLLEDLYRLNEELKKSDDTNTVAERVQKELDILNGIISLQQEVEFAGVPNKMVDNYSYELDKLYMDCNLPVRLTNSVLKKTREKAKGR